jgi:hypothetical protein
MTQPTVARLLITVLVTFSEVALPGGDELTGAIVIEKLHAAAAELPVVAMILLIAELPVAALPVAELPATELLSVESGRDAWDGPEGVTLHMLQRKPEEGMEETDRSSPARGTWT